MLQELQGWSCDLPEKTGTSFIMPTGCPYLAVLSSFQNSSQKLARILCIADVPLCNTTTCLPSSQDSFTRSAGDPEATWGFQREANINASKITGLPWGSRVAKAISDRSSLLCIPIQCHVAFSSTQSSIQNKGTGKGLFSLLWQQW